MIEDITEFYRRLSGENIEDDSIFLPIIPTEEKVETPEIVLNEDDEEPIFPFWDFIHLNFTFEEQQEEPIFQVLY